MWRLSFLCESLKFELSTGNRATAVFLFLYFSWNFGQEAWLLEIWKDLLFPSRQVYRCLLSSALSWWFCLAFEKLTSWWDSRLTSLLWFLGAYLRHTSQLLLKVYLWHTRREIELTDFKLVVLWASLFLVGFAILVMTVQLWISSW